MPRIFDPIPPDVPDIGDHVLPRILQRIQTPPVKTDTSTIYAPQWDSLTLRGTILSGQFTTYPGYKSVNYEVLTNTIPSTTGATVFLPMVLNRFDAPINAGGTSNLLKNGGWETGDKSDWIGFDVWGSPYSWNIVTAPVNGGSYAAKFIIPNGGYDYIYSIAHQVVPGCTYTFTGAFHLTIPSSIYPTGVSVAAYWYNSSDVYLSASTLIAIFDSPTGYYSIHSGSATAPTNAAYARIQIQMSNGAYAGDDIFYIDDMTLIGSQYVLPTNYFAVRGRFDDGTLTPCSTWLQPLRQTSVLGNAATIDHAQLDASAGTLRSARFAETADDGWQLSPDVLRAGYMRAGRLIGWGPFVPGNDDAIARGLSHDESDWIGFAVGDYAGGKYLYYTAASGLHSHGGVDP